MSYENKKHWDEVDEATSETFLASDAPGFIDGHTGPPGKDEYELNLNPEVVCGIIERVKNFSTEETSSYEDEDDNPGDDPFQLMAFEEGDLTYQELTDTINQLEPDQQITLVALMWLGRGDFELSEWQQCLDEATANRTEYTADYLLRTPLLASYLQEGLEQLGYSCDV